MNQIEAHEVLCPRRVHGPHEMVMRELSLDGARAYCRWCSRRWSDLHDEINTNRGSRA